MALSKLARQYESALREPTVVLSELQKALEHIERAEWAMLGVTPPLGQVLGHEVGSSEKPE